MKIAKNLEISLSFASLITLSAPVVWQPPPLNGVIVICTDIGISTSSPTTGS